MRKTFLATSLAAAAAAASFSCRTQPAATPGGHGDAVVLVTPDSPSELQRRLATLTPVRPGASTPASDKLDHALDAFHARTQARRGYVAVDKPLYKPGEAIWFRTFDLISADLAGGDARAITTFQLVSPRGAVVLESQVLEERGYSAGDFQLPTGTPGGEYILRATTDRGDTAERKVIVSSYQPPRVKKKLEFLRKAYGPRDSVAASLALHRATGEALANKIAIGVVTLDGAELTRVPVTTDPMGNAIVRFALPETIARGDGLLTILVEDGGVTESIQKRVPITLDQMQLALYPEGGDLVTGLPGRVYFAAKNSLDKPADIEGKVVDDTGATVALLRSHHDGMGRFDLTPVKGRTYHVEITRPSSITTTYALPAAASSGCAMQAIDDFTSVNEEARVAVWCTSSRAVVATAVMRSNRVSTATTSVRAGEPVVLALPTPAGAQGAVRVTLFDDALAPMAERLIYRNRARDLSIAITPDQATYQPRDRVTLNVETRGADGAPMTSDVALSVVDDTVLSFADDKQATMLARLYLEAEMPGQKIEEPNFYFTDDPKAPAAIDMVLGTHGWSRFEWKPVLSGPPKPPEPAIADDWGFEDDYWREPRGKAVEAEHERKKAEERLERQALADEAPRRRMVEVGDDDLRDDDGEWDEGDDEGEGGFVAMKKAEAPPDMAPMAAPMEPMDPQGPGPAPEAVVFAGEQLEGELVVLDGAPPMIDQGPMPGGNAAVDFEPQMDMPMAAPAADWGGDDEGWDGEELMVLQVAGGLMGDGVQGFEIGEGAVARHRIVVRGRNWGEADELAAVPDPYWNLVPERVFPQPTYTEGYDGPRTDFRDTIFWQSRLQTDAQGKAQVSFYLSDAVTSFKATAEGVGEGGLLGHGEALVQSKLPVSLAVKMPLEVSAGDHVRLPVTVTNETDQPYTATLTATFGKAFKVSGEAIAPRLDLKPGERRSALYELDVVGDGVDPADGKVVVTVDAASLRDKVEQEIRVVPIGFPQELSVAGTAARGKVSRHEVLVSDVIAGSMRGKLTLYPSPLATMIQGTEAIIREPGGCFEQASSANYPNIMILDYLEENGAAAPELIERTQGYLQNGYRLLTGYESPAKGYEWFGGDPGHEALTAYGLLEFNDMKKVFDDVDTTMVERTGEWLRNRRDGKGGFQKNPQALDSFGRASDEVTDAYITYALTEVGTDGIDREIGRQREMATTTKDAYVMALATNTLLNVEPKGGATKAAVDRLVGMQAEDGSFPTADHSITRSGGEALLIETTSLAVLAMLEAGDGYTPQVRKSIEWLDKHRDGFGGYGSTQSTVLALEAMTAYAEDSRRTQASGVVTIRVNGKEVSKLAYEKGHEGALEADLAQHLRTGKNVIEIELDSEETLPYSALVTWGSKVPATSPSVKVGMTTKLARDRVPLGEGVRMDVRVSNSTSEGIPMTMARVGLPGGLTFQTWQLQELRDKKLIDFYETREREVILYFRSMAPKAVVDIPLELLAQVPGTFVAPASQAYLYYTDEHRRWVAPSTVTVTP